MAAQTTAPLQWDRIEPDFSEFLQETAQQQQAVEKCTQEPANLLGLQALHSNGGADPCDLEAFKAMDCAAKAAHIEAEDKNAKQAQAAMAVTVKTSSDKASTVANTCVEAPSPVLKKKLTKLREDNLKALYKVSESVGEFENPDKMRSEKEILFAEYGPDEVNGMNDDAKENAYGEIRAKRIEALKNKAEATAEALLKESVLAEIMKEGRLKEELQLQVAEADKAEQRAQATVTKLEQALKEAEAKHSSCKARKLAVSKDLDADRRAYKKVLQELKACEAKFKDQNIENECLYIQEQKLSQLKACLAKELKKAKEALESAAPACDLWREKATQSQAEVEQCMAAHAKRVVDHEGESIKNFLVAMELLEKLRNDTAAEIESLEADKDKADKEVKTLKEQMKCGAGPQVSKKLARGKDKTRAIEDRIDKCQDSLTKITASLKDAREQYGRIKTLCAIDDTLLEQEAAKLANENYQDFCLYPKKGIIESNDEGDLPATNALAIQTQLMAQMKEQLKEELKAEHQADLQKLRMDMMVRGKQSNNSDMSSDCGETYEFLEAPAAGGDASTASSSARA